MPRHTRYQGAIIQDHHILLIQHREHASGRTYWVIPGGGKEEGESEEQCVVREMKEETNLDVAVERLLLNEPGHPGGVYKVRKTFLCRPVGGEARPGYEPELEAAADYAISQVRWFDLQDPASWDPDLKKDPITFSQVTRLTEVLGYEA